MFSFITVSYNSLDNIKLLYCSIIDNFKFDDFELIVVDNFKCNGLSEYCLSNNIKYIRNQSNLGFSKANNIGASNATNPWLFFINPDTKLDAIAKIYDLDENCIYLPYILEKSEDDSYGCVKNIIPTLGNYIIGFFNKNMAKYWYRGSALLINRKMFNKIGYWPENYFMYCEDLDFYYRANKIGIQVRRIPFFITHFCGQSSKLYFSNLYREKLIIKSLIIFYKKYNLRYSYLFAYIFTSLISFKKTPILSIKKIFFYYYAIIKNLC